MISKLFKSSGVMAGCVLGLSAHAAAISGQGTWETVLQGRDLNADGVYDAYYDTDQDITWLANARLARTLGIGERGRMDWDSAEAWVSGLDVHGVTGWRQYKTFPIKANGKCTFVDVGLGHDCTYYVTPTTSEMAYLYYVILENTGAADTVGWGRPGNNTGPFSNLGTNHFWSETDFIGYNGKQRAWNFGASRDKPGYQDMGTKYAPRGLHHVWPVLDGDVANLSPTVTQIPEPGTYLLMALGLIAVLAAAKGSRKQA